MQIWAGNGWCGDVICEGCPECDVDADEVVLTPEEFWELYDVLNRNSTGSPKFYAELDRTAKTLRELRDLRRTKEDK